MLAETPIISFCPLPFYPSGTELDIPAAPGGHAITRIVSLARIILDNFPHIKAYWVMIGPQLAQVALSFGADDMDGTVKEEVITHMAGAQTEQALGHKTLIRLIKEAGRDPVERDTLYTVLNTY